jgi:5-methylcytosine-specific restriction protein A
MARPIPEGIRPDHVIAAIRDLDAGAQHRFGNSTRYDLLYQGRRYPPKAVIGLAAGKLLGRPLGPDDFKGGLESKCFRVLEANGFTVVGKEDGAKTILGTQEKHSSEDPRNPDWTRDEMILALNLYLQSMPRFPAKDSESVIQLSSTLNRLGKKLFKPEERSAKFRNANGVYMKLNNFKRFDPAYTSKGRVGLSAGNSGEEEVWNEFHNDPTRCEMVSRAIVTTLDDPEVDSAWMDPRLDDSFEEAPEGRVLTRKHFVRERNKKLVRTKIASVLKQTGKLECEVCRFNFALFYGDRGLGFIECHHTKAVSMLDPESKTRMVDLALVCSNCHRMIHRTRPWLSIADLTRLLSKEMTDARSAH